MTAAALLLAALLAAPAPALPETPPRAPTLIVRARGLDEDALRDALRPRSEGADVALLRDVAAVDPDHTFVDVELRPPELLLTIILADGRVFARSAPAPAGPRDAARLVATMLAAIAGAALDPLPERGHSPALDPVPPDMSSRTVDVPLDVPVPERMSPEPPPPAPAPAPAPIELPPVLADLPPRPPAPRPGLDLALDGAPVLGLGVPATGLLAGAAGLGLHLRGARPWLVAATFRAARRELDQFGLTRLRIGLSAGAWLRRGGFELRVTAGVGVEPWIVTRLGKRVRPGDTAPAPVLLGGHLRVAPSLPLPGPLRLGLFVELAASAAPTGHAAQIYQGSERLFTLGGLEASVGLELQSRLVSARPRRG